MPLSRELKDAMRAAYYEKSHTLFDELALKPGDVFPLRSRSKRGKTYSMTVTPEGYVVHQGEGCEGEPFNGPLGCWHSRDSERYVMTTAVTRYEATPPPMVFTEEHKATLKNTICRGASDAELQLFIYACQDVGLNPFLKQIWAIVRNVNMGTKDSPKWEKQLTIQVGIDGYRAIRDRLVDGQGNALFDGMEGPQWSEDGEKWLDYAYSPKPKYARVGVYRRGIPRPFVASCRFEAYVQDSPLWGKMGAEQLAKCAEALAYRRAFPAQMGKLPSGPVADYEEPLPLNEAEPPAGYLEGEVTLRSEPESAQPAAQVQESPIASPSPTPPAAPVREPAAPIDLLNAIEKQTGQPAKLAALAVMPRLYGTAVITKLSLEDRADYARILRFRLANRKHEHEPVYTAQALMVCTICGDELQDAEPEAAPGSDVVPAQASLGT